MTIVVVKKVFISNSVRKSIKIKIWKQMKARDHKHDQDENHCIRKFD